MCCSKLWAGVKIISFIYLDLLKISEIIETVKNDVDIKVIKEHSNILREGKYLFSSIW